MEELQLPLEFQQIPEAFHKDVVKILESWRRMDSESAVKQAKKLLKRYDDSDTGFVRYLEALALLDQYEMQEAYEIGVDLQASETTRRLGALVLAEYFSRGEEYDSALEVLQTVTGDDSAALDARMRMVVIYAQRGMGEEAHETLCQSYAIAKNLEEPDFRAQLSVALGFLEPDTSCGMRDLLEEDAERLCTLMKENMDQSSLNTLVMRVISPYSVTANELAWPRAFFLSLLDQLEQTGWFTDDLKFIESGRCAVQSYEMNEDASVPPALAMFLNELGDAENPDEVSPDARWCGVRELEEHPEAWDYIKEHYPLVYKGVEDDVNELVLRDPETCKKKVLEDFMELQSVGKQTALRMLETERENANSGISDLVRDLDYYYFDYPEEVQPQVGNIVLHYFLHHYAEAAELCRDLLRTFKDEDFGFVRKLYAISLANTRKAREAVKIAESLTKEFDDDDEFRTVLAYAYMKDRNYRKARKVFESIEFSGDDPMLYCEGYIETLNRMGQADQIEDVILRARADCEFDDPEDISESTFYFVSHMMRMRLHAQEEQFEKLESDFQLLEKALYRRRPEGFAEDKVAEYTTYLCRDLMEHPESRGIFLRLLDLYTELRTFRTQERIVESGYYAYESYLADEDPKLNPLLAELAEMMTEDEDERNEEEYWQGVWVAAQVAQEEPGSVAYFLETYPHLSAPARSQLSALMEDPKREAEQAEENLHLLSGVPRNVIHTALIKGYADTKARMKRERKN